MEYENVTVSRLLNELEKQSHYKIIYKNSEIELERKVSISMQSDKISDFVKYIFRNTETSFEILDKLIVLFKRNNEKRRLDSIKISLKNRKELFLRGSVVDLNGKSLGKVNINIQGSHKGTVSNENGNYKLHSYVGDVVIFSHVGKTAIKYIVNENEFIKNITLLDDFGDLQEVIITSLGIEREKSALAYSVTTLKGEDMTKSRSGNIGSSLGGKVAGLQITNPATGVGGSTRVIIRGNTSIKGDNQPLFVIDGIPINNDVLGAAAQWGGSDRGDGLSNINPDDIEEITVLKGVSAGALYGSRASNGVILIQTKSGKSREGVGVELNSNFVFDIMVSDLNFQKQYGQGSRGLKYTTVEEVMTGDGRFSWGAKLDGSNTIQFDGVFRPYVNTGNAQKYFYRQGTTFSNTVTLTGGNENGNFRFSIADMKNESIMPNSGLTRNNYGLNLAHKFSNKLSANISVNYNRQHIKNAIRVSDFPMNANGGIAIFPANVHPENVKGNPDKLGANSEGRELNHHGSVWWSNPYWAAYQTKRDDKKERIIGKVELRYDVNDWMYVQTRLGHDSFILEQENLEPWGQGYGAGVGNINLNTRRYKETNLDVLVGIEKEISSETVLKIIAGGNQMREKITSKLLSGSNFETPDWNSYTNARTRSASIGFAKKGVNSLYYQAEISYKNKLFFTTTGRSDWFSTLLGKHVFYPSVGLSGLLNQLFELPESMDYFKVRTSWGQVGGDTEPYNTYPSYSLGTPHGGHSVGQIAQSIIPNIHLTPLTATEFEVGFDLKLFKNRLGLDMAYYTRRTKNDILSADLALESGYEGTLINIGEIANRGVELLLYGTLYKSDNFRWDTSINVGYNKSEVISLLEDEKEIEFLQVDQSRVLNAYIRYYKGKSYSQISGYKYLREDGGELILDANGFPQPDLEKGIVPLGSGVAPLNGGISNSIWFGAFDFRMLFDFKFGGYIHSGTNNVGYEFGLHQETLKGREEGLGIVPSDLVQRYYQTIAADITEPFVYKSDFIKLREMALGYQIPEKIVRKIGAHKINIALVARNLWVLHKKVPNIDPESTYHSGNAQGFEYMGLPRTRSFGCNLNIKF